MRAHLLAPDWSVWRQVGLDYISRLNWSKQGLPLVLAADKFDMGENTMKVSKVKGIDLRKKGSVVVNKEEEEEEEKEVGMVVCKSHQGQKLFSFFALLFFAMMFLKLVMDVGDHKGGRRTTRTMWATKKRLTTRSWTTRRRWTQWVGEER